MPIPLEIGNERFPSKTAATGRCQEILHSYPGQAGSGAGQPEEVIDPTHVAFLTALVHRHPEADEKIGSGIAGFKVQVNPNGTGNTRCFYVIHPDGSSVQFSYPSCL